MSENLLPNLPFANGGFCCGYFGSSEGEAVGSGESVTLGILVSPLSSGFSSNSKFVTVTLQTPPFPLAIETRIVALPVECAVIVPLLLTDAIDGFSEINRGCSNELNGFFETFTFRLCPIFNLSFFLQNLTLTAGGVIVTLHFNSDTESLF